MVCRPAYAISLEGDERPLRAAAAAAEQAARGDVEAAEPDGRRAAAQRADRRESRDA
eukprot:gene31735-46316_t